MTFEDDIVVGTIYRKNEIYGKHILRSACVFAQDSKNRLLLQLRSKTSNYPLHWDVSGAGHVDSGESYENCAKRELFEEVGIKIKSLILLGKHDFVYERGRKRISCAFIGEVDSKHLEIDAVEVAEARWFSIDEIKKMIENNEKFHPECEFLLKKYLLD